MIFQEILIRISGAFKRFSFKGLRALSFLKIITFLLFATTSCSDNGCVEADDFGEYQTKTLVVKASQSVDSCTYDLANRNDLMSETHGSGLHRCFRNISVDITDSAGATHNSIAGCSFWQPQVIDGNGVASANPNVNMPVMNLCVIQCRDRCNTLVMSGASNPKPNWVSTAAPGSGEVVLAPGAEIRVRAIGSVTLGGAQLLNTLHVYPNNNSFFPVSRNESGVDIYQEVSPGDVFGLKFSGGFIDGDTLLGSTTATVGDVGLMNLAPQSDLEGYFASNPEDRADLINATRRLVIHVDETPLGYRYSQPVSGSSPYRDANVGGIPIEPYHLAWRCAYSGNSLFESICGNDISTYMAHYTGLGGTAPEIGERINAAYPISSADNATNSALTSSSAIGGILKVSADQNRFRDESAYRPFAGCSAGFDCTGVSSTIGAMARDLSGGSSRPISIGSNSQIYFKYLDASCSGSINVEIKPSSVAGAPVLYRYTDVAVGNSWTPGVTANGPIHISGQSNQFIEVERVAGSPTTFTPSTSSSAIDCGRSLAIKFVPYFDFTVTKSGLVSFANLAPPGASGSCNIGFRIINPTGSHAPISIPAQLSAAYGTGILSAIEADFYEYGDFNSNNAPESSSSLVNINANWNSGLSGKIYVRKGQKIRFAPESWAGNWVPQTGLQRKCGVGMAVRIEHRPALLCRGQGNQSVRNPSCSRNIVSGEVRGCLATSPVCTDNSPNNNSGYCPSVSDCVGAINLTDPTDPTSPRTETGGTGNAITRMVYPTTDPEMQSHACGYVYEVQADPNGGTITRSGIDSSKRDKCNVCQNAMLAAGLQAPEITQSNVQHCYNLENYTGKVDNITNQFNDFFPNFAPSTLPSHASITKGLTKLNRFNGIFGHIGDYGNVLDRDRLIDTSSNHFFNRRGRLQLMILDGKDFRPATIASSYTNNSVSQSVPVSYSRSGHNNGFKVKFSSFLEFGNGENLEVLFCKEDDENSTRCAQEERMSETANPPDLSNVPFIADFSTPDNSFAFDDHGNLFRSTGIRNDKNNCDGVGVGDNYFCHCRGDFAAGDKEGCNIVASDGDGSPCDSPGSCLYRLSFRVNDPEIKNCLIPVAPTAGIPAPADLSACNQNLPGSTSSNTGVGNCTGIKADNPNFEPTTSTRVTHRVTGVTVNRIDSAVNNIGAICSYADLSGATDCTKQFKCVSKYSNNRGRYNVVVRVKNRDSAVSGLVSGVINPVLRVMDGYTNSNGVRIPGQAERIYNLIIRDQAYILLLKLSLVLMISFYGLTFLMGLNEGGTADIFSKVIKIGLILFFVSEGGWDMFSAFVVNTFKHGTDELTFLMATAFDSSSELRNAVDNQDYGNKAMLFSSVDKVMGLFFASAVQKKISALLFSGLFGWLYILIIYYAFVAYIMAVSTAVLVYLTAQVFISVLFILGPIFFIFTLFEKTKEMFDKWLQQLIGFSLQQMFLLITLSFFNMMMYEIIKNSLGYRVCWDEVWTINILIRISLMSFWTIPNIPPLFDSQAEMGSSGRGEGVPSFFSILFIWMVAKLMREFISFMTGVASDIGGGISAMGAASSVLNSAAAVRKGISKKTGLDKAYQRTIGEGVRMIDHRVFNSGKNAKAARNKKRAQDSTDLKNKGSMVDAGRSAVNKFKRKNGAELAGKSAAEKDKILESIRDKAMDAAGKKKGLNQGEIDRLKKDTGTKYRGDNLMGYVKQRAYQKIKKGGSVSNSITSSEVKQGLSKSQAKEALKNTDKEGREAMMKDIKQGKMFVESGRISKRTAPKISSMLPKLRDSKAHKQAIAELSEENQIDGGKVLGAFRSDEDKKKIRKRAKEIRRKDGHMDKSSRASTIAALDVEKDFLDVEQGEASEEQRKEMMTQSALSGKEVRKGAYDARQLRAAKRKEVKKDRLQDVKGALQEKAENFEKDAESNEAKANSIGEQIIERQGGAEFNKLGELKNELKAEGTSKERKAQIKKQMPAAKKAYKSAKSAISNMKAKQSEFRNAAANSRIAAGQAGGDLEAVNNAIDVQAGADHVLNAPEGEFSPAQIKIAKKADKDLGNIQETKIGTKGGYGATGAARAAIGVALAPLSAAAGTTGMKAAKALSDKFKGATRAGVLGSREKSSREAMSDLGKKYGEGGEVNLAKIGKDAIRRDGPLPARPVGQGRDAPLPPLPGAAGYVAPTEDPLPAPPVPAEDGRDAPLPPEPVGQGRDAPLPARPRRAPASSDDPGSDASAAAGYVAPTEDPLPAPPVPAGDGRGAPLSARPRRVDASSVDPGSDT